MSQALYPWQHESWRQLQQLRGQMPHALLLHGAPGIGKVAFAERFAQSLLCQHCQPDGQACGQCVACGWFTQYSHPDFRRIRPEILEDNQGEDTPEESSVEPVSEEKKTAKSAKKPSKEIKIEQIRGLTDLMNISTHRHGTRVVLVYPAEAMNGVAANALLKTLEEPPPATVMVLVSHSRERLLPTILSRCRQQALPLPAYVQAQEWLRAQGLAEPDLWLAEQGGAPLAAQEAAQGGNQGVRDELLRMLARPDVAGALNMAEQLQKHPLDQVVAWLQRWHYDLFSCKLSGKIRYYPHYAKELTALAGKMPAGSLSSALKALNQRRRVASHPLSAKLFIEDMLLAYLALYSIRS